MPQYPYNPEEMKGLMTLFVEYDETESRHVLLKLQGRADGSLKLVAGFDRGPSTNWLTFENVRETLEKDLWIKRRTRLEAARQMWNSLGEALESKEFHSYDFYQRVDQMRGEELHETAKLCYQRFMEDDEEGIAETIADFQDTANERLIHLLEAMLDSIRSRKGGD